MSPRSRKTKAARNNPKSRLTIDRNEKQSENFIDKIQTDLEKNQSYLNLILGALIVIVLGVLIFNYFNKSKEDNGNITDTAQSIDEQGDVTKDSLPGTYTVKEGDTLFLIAQKYYDDGNKYSEIVKENKLSADSIETGQKLTIPKLELMESVSSSPQTMEPSPSASAEANPTEQSASPNIKPDESPTMPSWGKGGATNQTTWGETITGSSYTVVKGDWLSKIAGRSYGNIMQYDKIAKANNISDPNLIEVGMILKIPRD